MSFIGVVNNSPKKFNSFIHGHRHSPFIHFVEQPRMLNIKLSHKIKKIKN